MARAKITTSGTEGTPQAFAETLPRISDMPAYTNQVLFEMSNTLGKLDAKLDGVSRSQAELSKQIDGLGERLSGLEHKASFLQGVLICAVFLIPFCAAVIWWSLGQRIEEALKIELPNQAATPTTPPPP